MREWMKAQKRRPFTKRDVYLGIGIDDPEIRAVVRNAFKDFTDRGEIALLPPDKRNLRQDICRYRYNHAWRNAQKGVLKPMIFKAMYVSGTFAATDIARLTDQKRDWIDRVIKTLRAQGHIAQVGRRNCAHGAGAENLYHIVNRDRYRLEVMR